MKRILYPIAVVAALAGLSCRHHPVYPDYGQLYVTSSPAYAEVMLDGVSTKQSTPARLTGVAEGSHELALRLYGYKVTRQQVTVQGGMTTRAAVRMEGIIPRFIGAARTDRKPRHMAYEPEQQRIYVANYTNNIDVFQIAGSSVALASRISVPSPGTIGSKLVAVSRPAGKLYTTLWRDSVIVVDLATQAVLKRFKLQADSTNCVQMRFTADGRTVYLADSLRRRIWVVNASADTVAGFLPLSGTPSDFLVDPRNGHLYVTLASTKRLVELDGSGAVLRTAPTGNRPGRMFHDDSWTRLGFCNTADKRNTVVDPAAGSLANGPVISTLDPQMNGGVFGHDGTHLWTITGSLPYWISDDEQDCDPGTLHLIYLPTMQYATHLQLRKQPIAIEQTPDGRFLLVLHQFDQLIAVYRSETE